VCVPPTACGEPDAPFISKLNLPSGMHRRQARVSMPAPSRTTCGGEGGGGRDLSIGPQALQILCRCMGYFSECVHKGV